MKNYVRVVWWRRAGEYGRAEPGPMHYVGAFTEAQRASDVRESCRGDWIDTGYILVELDPVDR